MNQKRLAILLIATGPYTVFWDEFYKSFERKKQKIMLMIDTILRKDYIDGVENM